MHQNNLLTFRRGRFFFNEEPIDLKAAAALREHADVTAKKVFSRALNRLYDLPALPPLSFLDPHQIEGVKWILSRKRSYLAHAPGAGKTAQAIIAADIVNEQALFIVPPSLPLNWGREIDHWAFTEWAIVPQSEDKDEMDWYAQFIICPDSLLTRDWVQEGLKDRRFGLVAVDEASRFKEPTSERSKAFYGGYLKDKRFCAGLFQNARHVVLLDGSPMPNRHMELWAPAYALDPECIDFMDRHEFGLKFCGGKINNRGQWEFNHSTNGPLLRQMLRSTFMHVIAEKDLRHPERRRSMLILSKDGRSPELKSWERRHLGLFDFTLGEDVSQGELAEKRRELGISKIPAASARVKELLEGTSESILVFAWHREVCEGLAQKLKCDLVYGGTSNDDREKTFERFQSGRTRVIVCNIASAGRGHNLQKADRVIFAEFSWTDELNKQCEKRASRRGREEENFVRCEYLVSPDSMDEKVMKTLFRKEKDVKGIME